MPMGEKRRKARKVLDSITCQWEKKGEKHVGFWIVLRAGERK